MHKDVYAVRARHPSAGSPLNLDSAAFLGCSQSDLPRPSVRTEGSRSPLSWPVSTAFTWDGVRVMGRQGRCKRNPKGLRTQE